MKAQFHSSPRSTGEPQSEVPRRRSVPARSTAVGKRAGQVALISGGEIGDGRKLAVRLAREGADVAILHRPEEGAEARRTITAVEAIGRRCIAIAGDVSDSTACERAVERTVRTFGHLDILVDNGMGQKAVGSHSDAPWDPAFPVNAYGQYYLTRAAVTHLKQGGAIMMESQKSRIESRG